MQDEATSALRDGGLAENADDEVRTGVSSREEGAGITSLNVCLGREGDRAHKEATVARTLMGRTERDSKEWKRQLRLAVHGLAPNNVDEWYAMGELRRSVRSRYQNRGGFSPMQRVFGFTHRLPAALFSDDPNVPE